MSSASSAKGRSGSATTDPGPDWLALYFSKRDSRTWVPKKLAGMGWTLNLARREGVYWLIVFLVGLPSFMIGLAVGMALALDH